MRTHAIAKGFAPVLAAGLLAACATQPTPLQGEYVEVTPQESDLLAAVEWTPTTTEDVLRRTGLVPGEALAVLNRLELMGLVRSGPGWWERVGRGP